MKNSGPMIQVPRKALMKQLDSHADKRLIYIHSRAGYGKTVTAQLWLKHRQEEKVRNAWITLDEYDNKAALFCKRFAAALLNLQPNNEKLHEYATHPSFNQAPDEFTIHMLNEFHYNEQKYILVIDDLHVINNESILQLLSVFYKRLPENALLLVLSRFAPHDILADLVLKGNLLTIGMEDLRFTSDEIKSLFEKNNVSVTKKQVNEMYLSTGGWAIALRALLMSGGESYGMNFTNEYLEAFLKERLWEKWDVKYRENMLKVSVVEELTPGLWTALTGDKDGGNKLNELAKNAFIRVSEEKIYRFHDLFREFLLSMLRQQNKIVLEKQIKKAADWFYTQKDYFRAVTYYFKCGDMQGVSKGFKNMYNYNSPYASVKDTAEIIRMCVNEAAVEKYPFLLETLGWAAYVEGRGTDMENYLDRYFKQLPKIIIQNPISAHTAYLMRVMDYRNSLIELTKSVKNLPLGILPHVNTPSITKNLPLPHRSARDFTEYVFDEEKNLKLFSKTVGALVGEECDIIVALLKAGLAYERGNLSTAHELALTSNAMIKETYAPELQFCSFIILAAVLNAQGRQTELEQTMNAANEMIERYKAFYLSANYRAFSCSLKLTTGDMKAAQQWLENDGESPYNDVAFYKIYRCFTTAKAYIVIGDYNTAIILLKKILSLGTQYRRPLDVIESKILMAVAYRKKSGSNQKTALEYLESAINTAYKYGYTQIFIENGANLSSMLHMLQKRAVQAEYKDNLPGTFVKSLYLSAVAASKHSKGLSGGRMPASLIFTEQQKKVMRLMCEGLSRKESAEKMGISPDGVKQHMKLIYKKLDVYSNVEAVIKIKEQGILDG